MVVRWINLASYGFWFFITFIHCITNPADIRGGGGKKRFYFSIDLMRQHDPELNYSNHTDTNGNATVLFAH